MARTKTPSGKKKHGFLLFTLIYGFVLLLAVAVGLSFFWNFIDAYEQSRPINPVKAYMAELSYDTVRPYAEELIDEIDPNLQSRDACEAMIRQVMSETITYSKLASESDDAKRVFVLRSGLAVIGRMTIVAGEPDRYGFSRWEVSHDEFDFSYLIGQPETVIVPEEYQVVVNGNVLDESYITETDLEYPLLGDYYKRFPNLPRLVKYEMGACLGEISYEILDAQGNPAQMPEDGNMDVLLHNCDRNEMQALDGFIAPFLDSYIAYTGSAEHNVYGAYANLSKHLVPGSDLQERLLGALAGLIWAQSMGDNITSIDVHHYVRLDDTHYLCDITYLVNTIGGNGVVETVNNVRIVITETAKGLKAEALTIY